MKAVTVRQPWALLIMQGKKTVEVRAWFPEHRGRILVHAAARIDADALAPFQIGAETLTRGAILGSVDVVAVFRFTEQSWEQLRERTLERGAFDPRLFGWVLRDPVQLRPPLPWRGNLGLFDVPDGAVPDAVRSGVRET